MQDRIGRHLRIRGEQGGAAGLHLLAQRGWQGAALQPYLDFGRVVTRLPGAFGGAQVTQRRGVRGIGLQAHFEGAPDMARIQKALDRLSRFNLPIKITEFDCWAKDEAVQAQALDDVYRIAFASPHPFL